MTQSNFTETVADTAEKLRTYAGKLQRLASQLEKLQSRKLPTEFETKIGVELTGVRDSLDASAFDDMIGFLRQINEASSK